MSYELINNIQFAINDAKKTYKKVKEEQELAAKLNAEEARKKAALEKAQRIKSRIGCLDKNIKEAAEKGLNYVTIFIPADDMEKDRSGSYTEKIKKNTTTFEVCNFLEMAFKDSLILKIHHDIKEDSGAYNERLIYHQFYIKVTFA